MATITFGFSELKEEYKDEASVRAMIENEKEDVREKYLELQRQNPEEFAYLYQMKNNLNLSAGDVAGITTDKNGKMALIFSNKQEGKDQFYITALKQEKTDGNTNFTGSLYLKDADVENFSSEKMKNLVETLSNTGVDVKKMASSNERLSMLLRVINDMVGQGEINPLELDDAKKQGAKLTGDAARRFQDALKAMRDAIDKKGKTSNCKETTEGGYKVFNLYKFNPARKEGPLPAPDARIYVKDCGNGKVSYKYHMKDNGKLDDEVAGYMAAGMAAAGFDSADLSSVPGPERGVLMKALAKKGLVPVGVHISKADGDEIIKALEGSDLSTKERKEFKEKLAASMEAYNKAHGENNDLERNFIASLKSEVRNDPLKDAWDNGGLRSLLAEHTRSSDQPEETLAAMYSATKILNAYKDFDSVEEMLAMPVGAKTSQSPKVVIFDTQEEKERIAELFKGREGISISDLSAKDMTDMFDKFMIYGKEKSEKELLAIYEKNEREYTARQFDRTIILSLYNQRKNILTSTTEELGAQGCKIDLPTMNQPDTYAKGQKYARKIKAQIQAEQQAAGQNATNAQNTTSTQNTQNTLGTIISGVINARVNSK